MFDISVLGDKKLQKKLDKMDKKLRSKTMKASMKTAMEPVKELAKQRAPRDRGLLQRSIRIGTKMNRKGVSAMVRTGTRRQLKIDPSDKFYYPAAIEYGSRFMPARSFLRSALSTRREKVLNIFGRELTNNLVKA